MTYKKTRERLESVKSYINDDHFKEVHLEAIDHAIILIAKIEEIELNLQRHYESNVSLSPFECNGLVRYLQGGWPH